MWVQETSKGGQLVKIYADVQEIGNSSATINIEARAHNVYSGEQKVIVSTKIKFVRIDENGDPIPISDRVKTKYLEKTRDYRESQTKGPN